MSSEMRNILNEIHPGIVERQRTIAIAACSYSHVIQCRSWLPDAVGAVAWFSFDNPGESPRIPIYAGVTHLPASFAICGQKKYRTDAAIWSFRETNKLATLNWMKGRSVIEPAVEEFENKAFEETPAIEAKAAAMINEGKSEEAGKFLTSYTNSFAGATIARWQEMKAVLWDMFGRGF
jgi:dipeptidase